MTDIHSKSARSFNMSKIRSKDSKPEIIIRKFLHSQGFRYRLHVKTLPGTPDIALPKYNTVILVHGCFWHRHQDCKFAAVPETNVDYWLPKLQKNVERDKANIEKLEKIGWKIIVVWECELKQERAKVLEQLAKIIRENGLR